jgi:NitT/TauT family transport system permease protein
LFLITLAGIALFLVVIALSRLVLGSWHDSVVERET